MVRLLHSSDWHLGRFLYGRSLLEDQAFALEHLLQLIDREKPHGLLISGDLFDRSLPPEEAVTLLNSFLNETIQRRGLPVFLIPGNHDSAERLGFAAQLLRHHRLTIFSRVEDSFAPVTLEGDNAFKVQIYGIPFVEPSLIGRALNIDGIRSHQEALSYITEKIMTLGLKKNDEPSVLLCHAFVIGGELSESEKELSVGGSSQVDAGVFKDFDYVALGHLHKPQKMGRDGVRYSGSLLPYSKSEVGHKKSISEIILSPAGVEIKTHELPLLRNLRYLEGELQTILEQGLSDPAAGDYVIVGLSDRGAVFDGFSRLRLIYPNLLHVSKVVGHESEQLPALRIREHREKNNLDLFAEFFRQAAGEEMSDGEKAALIEAWGGDTVRP